MNLKHDKEIIFSWLTRKQLISFSEYTLIGLLSFGLDILLMWLFISTFGIHYLIGVSVAFILSTIFNYTLNRLWSFRGTRTNAVKSYFKFFALATINLGVIVGLVYIFVEFFNTPALISRIIAGLILFVSNYILNAIFIFKLFPRITTKIKKQVKKHIDQIKEITKD